MSLVDSLAREIQRHRRQCLSLLSQRRLLLATRLAQECYELSASESNAKLLATCHLLSGNFAAATRIPIGKPLSTEALPKGST
ncbi:hypothetical protein OAS39_00315 [Pirellulales bacterium]|nr:hypothetical protein [Pirellulales bacterium]